jgi:hypothetical protein
MSLKKKNAIVIKPCHFVLSTGPYEHDILVFINCRSEEIAKRIKKTWVDVKPFDPDNIKEIDSARINSALYLYHSDKQHRSIVLFADNWGKAISLFAHESLHCTFDVLGYSGVKYCSESEEAFTYLQGWLTAQFLRKA